MQCHGNSIRSSGCANGTEPIEKCNRLASVRTGVFNSTKYCVRSTGVVSYTEDSNNKSNSDGDVE